MDIQTLILEDGYTQPGETVEGLWKRIATAGARGDSRLENRLLEYFERGWIMPSTPILSNLGTSKGLPIACYLTTVQNSVEGIVDHHSEVATMATMGGGVSSNYTDLLPSGSKTSKGVKTSGAASFMKVEEAIMGTYKQGTRRGASVVQLDISHPEVYNFLYARMEHGGDPRSKLPGLHLCVSICDSFMTAVLQDASWNLVCPVTGEVKETVSARGLFETLVWVRCASGEPYIFFKDNANRISQHPEGYEVRSTNLCVTGNTLVLTDQGHQPIESILDKEVNVWNGVEWSKVTPKQTSLSSEIVRVTLSDGKTLECTPYHKFYIQEGYSRGGKVKEVRAKDLSPGVKLEKMPKLPVVPGGKDVPKAYQNGFFSGDGCEYKGSQIVYFYHGKQGIIEKEFSGYTYTSDAKQKRSVIKTDKLLPKFTVPTVAGWSVRSRLDWLAGLLDADGSITNNQGAQSLQIASVNKQFLSRVQLMLQTLGVDSKISKVREAGEYFLPANNGTGALKEYTCSTVHRLVVNHTGTESLYDLGMRTHRLKFIPHKTNRDARVFVKVVSVEKLEERQPTYCFTEPKRNRGVFNGILTGQCSEILLKSEPGYSAVCCLAAFNCLRWDEYKEYTQVFYDKVEFLDNVLEEFIEKTEHSKNMQPARRSVINERAIGIGLLGWHSYLQDKLIPFESEEAKYISAMVHLAIMDRCRNASWRLGQDKGHAPIYKEFPGEAARRNFKLFAIAPNATTAMIAGGLSGGIEPYMYNVMTRRIGDAGNIFLKNPQLLKHIPDDDPRWGGIMANAGSVQHLNLDPKIKEAFKTAFEIDQGKLLEHAAVRQGYLDHTQSLNLFIDTDKDLDGKKAIDLHIKAWQLGLPTLYYVHNFTNTQEKEVACLGCAG